MARAPLSYYMSPEDEEALLYGPPAPPALPNLGVAPVPRLALDTTTPRMTDRSYADTDAYRNAEPSEEELAADEVAEEELPPNPYAEAAQARTQLAQREAPAAIDPRAASVPDEQKGVPAQQLALSTDLNAENAWADELLGQVQKRVLERPEASESALHQQAEGVVSKALEPKEGFSRQRQGELATAAYGEDSKPSTRWEDELLKERGDGRLTDAQIRRRGAAIGLVMGLTTGDTSMGERWASAQRSSNQSFDEQRGKARDRDRAETRISRGLAAAIAQTGVPPEEAVKLTYGDPLVKAFSSGMYSQGGRAEGQALGREKAQWQLAEKLIASNNEDDRARGLAILRSLTQLQVAHEYASAKKPAPVDPNDPNAVAAPTQRQRAINNMSRRLGVDMETAERFWNGDTRGLEPEQARKVANARVEIAQQVNDERLDRAVVTDVSKTETGAEAKRGNAVEQSIALAQNDPKAALKWQNDWVSAQMPLKEAIRGWKSMSQSGKEAFVEWTKNGAVVDQFAKAFMYAPGDQVHASKVLAAINSQVKADAGSAVTGSEWDRIAARIGIPTGTWAPFNDPAVVESFLTDSARIMTEHRKDYERIMGGWK